MKKSLVMGLALLVAITGTTSTFAGKAVAPIVESEVSVRGIINEVSVEVESEVDANVFPTLCSQTYLSDYYYDVRDYSKSFTCSSIEGNALGIYVENNGNTTVNFKIYMDGIDMGTRTVEAGKSLTRTFTNPSGVHENFKVVVSNDIGEVLKLIVTARQYDK
ncbi:MAG: hypothetical protein ATN36_02420 [Epulopiscium sp. Nele67-Bin005]|nr:MAG: hypothetical protein ATN36_02420 [Epulopiscium sp. Nele67-Bin005]